MPFFAHRTLRKQSPRLRSHSWVVMRAVFALLLCLLISPHADAKKNQGYRVTIRAWVPEAYGKEKGHPYLTPMSHYTVIELSPTNDGHVYINGDWPNRKISGPTDEASLKKWAENLALKIEDGILDGYIARKLIQRDGPLHRDLKQKETILDGRSGIIAILKDDIVMASLRLSLARENTDGDETIALLPGELRAPGGPRQIFANDPVIEVKRPTGPHNSTPGIPEPYRSRSSSNTYKVGGRPAELKSLLSREDLSDIDFLPTLFSLFESANFQSVIAEDLGLPIPTHIVAEAPLSLYNKIYKYWGFQPTNQEADSTLGDTLVHMSVLTTEVYEKTRNIMFSRVYRDLLRYDTGVPDELSRRQKDEPYHSIIFSHTKRLFRGSHGLRQVEIKISDSSECANFFRDKKVNDFYFAPEYQYAW